jgi:glycosyltransferase involved in cell wall biosynthesis
MKVTLYAIAKNEENNIEKFLLNAKKFDDAIVVDTGSTDNTVQLLKDAGIKVYEHPQTREEFDFSVARNQALSYVETDWAFALDFNEDVDEFYPEGFAVIADEFTKFNHLRFDDNGTDEPKQSNEVHTRLHRTKSYIWVNAVHEVPNFIPTEDYLNEVSVDTTIKITKKINKTVDKELFYFNICEREHQKDPTNWYWIWFIFNHYFNVKNGEKALEYGQEFLNISKPYFDSFRVLAFIRCSQILIGSGNIQQGANYAFHAVSEGMNFGGELMGNAFMNLLMVGKILNNPNITIFASGFNPETALLSERIDAINLLYNQIKE